MTVANVRKGLWRLAIAAAICLVAFLAFELVAAHNAQSSFADQVAAAESCCADAEDVQQQFGESCCANAEDVQQEACCV